MIASKFRFLYAYLVLILVTLSNFRCLFLGLLPQYEDEYLPDRSQVFDLSESDRLTYLLLDPEVLEHYYYYPYSSKYFHVLLFVYFILLTLLN